MSIQVKSPLYYNYNLLSDGITLIILRSGYVYTSEFSSSITYLVFGSR